MLVSNYLNSLNDGANSLERALKVVHEMLRSMLLVLYIFGNGLMIIRIKY